MKKQKWAGMIKYVGWAYLALIALNLFLFYYHTKTGTYLDGRILVPLLWMGYGLLGAFSGLLIAKKTFSQDSTGGAHLLLKIIFVIAASVVLLIVSFFGGGYAAMWAGYNL